MTSSKRIEGAEIAFEDVKLGDRVRSVTREKLHDTHRTIQLEGFVGSIGEDYIKSTSGSRLFVATTKESTLYLDTAVENDTATAELDGLPYESIVKFRDIDGRLAVAIKGETRWGIVVVDSHDWSATPVYFRAMLREAGDIFDVIHRGPAIDS